MNRGVARRPVSATGPGFGGFLELAQDGWSMRNMGVLADCLMEVHDHLTIQTPMEDLQREFRLEPNLPGSPRTFLASRFGPYGSPQADLSPNSSQSALVSGPQGPLEILPDSLSQLLGSQEV
jgi:hypothetical protein